MQNDISKEFSLGGLLRFTFPTIIMMMFVATYIIADGIFVSRFVGTAALSAINIVYPLINVMLGVGIMLGTRRQCHSLAENWGLAKKIWQDGILHC